MLLTSTVIGASDMVGAIKMESGPIDANQIDEVLTSYLNGPNYNEAIAEYKKQQNMGKFRECLRDGRSQEAAKLLAEMKTNGLQLEEHKELHKELKQEVQQKMLKSIMEDARKENLSLGNAIMNFSVYASKMNIDSLVDLRPQNVVKLVFQELLREHGNDLTKVEDDIKKMKTGKRLSRSFRFLVDKHKDMVKYEEILGLAPKDKRQIIRMYYGPAGPRTMNTPPEAVQIWNDASKAWLQELKQEVQQQLLEAILQNLRNVKLVMDAYGAVRAAHVSLKKEEQGLVDVNPKKKNFAKLLFQELLREHDNDLTKVEDDIRENLANRSEEHTSELSHITISYAVFCLKKKKNTTTKKTNKKTNI